MKKLFLAIVALLFQSGCTKISATSPAPNEQSGGAALFNVANVLNTIPALKSHPNRDAYLDRAEVALKVARLRCGNEPVCRATVPSGTKSTLVILYGPGRISMGTEQCIQLSAATPNLDLIVVEGAGRSGLGSTLLDYSEGSVESCDGMSAINVQIPGMVVVKNLTMVGGYRGFDKVGLGRKTLAHDNPENWPAGSIRRRWQKAFLARNLNGNLNAHLELSQVDIDGFYYGVAAEDGATAHLTDMTISNAGDAAVFAFTAGNIYASRVTTRYSADSARNLGFGFVAESLNHAFDPAVKNCRDLHGNNAGAYNNCVIEAALNPAVRPSIIQAVDCVAHENFLGGFLANTGAIILAEASKAHGHQHSYNDGKPTHQLDDADIERPNIYPPDFKGGGFGFLARHGSQIVAMKKTMSYNNFIGFQAFFDSVMYTPYALAWDNAHFGFHTANKGRINAYGAWAFGQYQKYGFATNRSDSMIDVSATLTINPYRTIPSFCAWNIQPCPHFVLPVKQAIDFNLPIFKTLTPGNAGLFYR